MTPADDTLDSRRERFAFELAKGQTLKEAASLAGIGQSTGHTWKTEPALQRRVSELRVELFSLAVGVLADGNQGAARKLNELVGSPVEKVALAAARAVLETGDRLRMSEAFGEELAALRREIEELKRARAEDGTEEATV